MDNDEEEEWDSLGRGREGEGEREREEKSEEKPCAPTSRTSLPPALPLVWWWLAWLGGRRAGWTEGKEREKRRDEEDERGDG